MTKTQSDSPLRFRLYFWVMNASFVAIMIGLASEVVEAFTGYDAFGMAETWQVVIGTPLAILSILAPVPLIAIRAWRDEYAESVWKRTVGLMAVVFAVGPFLLGIFLTIAYAIIGGEEAPAWLDSIYGERRPVLIIFFTWYVFNAAFVVIFQIVRWWDSR